MAESASSTARALSISELVLEVVSHLSQPDLARTALVSREWWRKTVGFLYREPEPYSLLVARTRPNYQRLSRLVETVRARPDLATLVQGVRLELSGKTRGSARPTKVQLATQLVLECFNLHSAQLHSTASAASQFMPILGGYASRLASLCLGGCHDFEAYASLLALFPNLVNLEITDVQLDSSTVLHWPQPPFRLAHFGWALGSHSTRELSLTELEWLLDSSRQSLQTAEIDPCGTSACELLAQPWPSLRELELHQYCELGDAQGQAAATEKMLGMIQLGRKPGLRAMRLSAWAVCKDVREAHKFYDQASTAIDQIEEALGHTLFAVEWSFST